MTMLVRRSVALLLTVSLLLLSAGALAGPPGARKPGSPGKYTPPAAGSMDLLNVVITQGFDTVTGTPPCVAGWSCQNLSTPPVLTSWFQGNPATFAAQAGANANSYIAANFENTSDIGTISNWLITPLVNFNPGAVLTFYTRTVDIPEFADRLEVRISTNGSSTNVGATSASVGDFTTLIFTVNPGLLPAAGTICPPSAVDGYPNTWCQITLTSAQGIPTTGSGRIAFRYFVAGGGPNGTASDYIGIDTFVFDEGIPIAPPVFAYSPPATWTVPFTGGTTVGTTGTASIAVSIGTAGVGSGAAATTTTTCTAPIAPFSGFGETVTAEGTGAISGGPLTGSCTLGTVAVTQTLTCSEVRAGVPTPVTFTMFCPAAGTPVFLGASSRRVQGGAGTFDLPISPVLSNPTVEPRQGPAQTVVFTFDKVITSATASIAEGAATAGTPQLSGNDVIVNLTGVIDRQYVIVVVSNVSDASGNTGGIGTARVGFLLGDVTQSRVVTVSDVGVVNGQLAQTVGATNFLKDINASGAITLTDKGLTNGNLTQSLPPP